MSKLVEFVRAFVKEKHSKQKRWNGDDYFTHLEAVEEIALQIAREYYSDLSDSQLEELQVVALEHDLEEDQNISVYESTGLLTKEGFGQIYNLGEIMESLKLLNKHNFPDYLEFVLAAAKRPYSHIVKIADLTHNSSDLKRGNMADKYRMALHILKRL